MKNEKKVVLTDIPAAEVEMVVKDFTSEGATEVAKLHQSNGNWTVRALLKETDL